MKKLDNKLALYVIKVLLTLQIVLTFSCCHSRSGNVLGSVHQPPILAIRAGTKVLTKEGLYTAEKDEVWHSDRRYRELEVRLSFK